MLNVTHSSSIAAFSFWSLVLILILSIRLKTDEEKIEQSFSCRHTKLPFSSCGPGYDISGKRVRPLFEKGHNGLYRARWAGDEGLSSFKRKELTSRLAFAIQVFTCELEQSASVSFCTLHVLPLTFDGTSSGASRAKVRYTFIHFLILKSVAGGLGSIPAVFGQVGGRHPARTGRICFYTCVRVFFESIS